MEWSRWILAICSIAIVAGFFLPWASLGGDVTNGLSVAQTLGKRGQIYWLLYFFPICAIAVAFLSFRWRRIAAAFASLLGVIALAFGITEVARLLYEVTYAGLWLSIAGSVGMLLTGLLTFRSPGHSTKEKVSGNKTLANPERSDAGKADTVVSRPTTASDAQAKTKEDQSGTMPMMKTVDGKPKKSDAETKAEPAPDNFEDTIVASPSAALRAEGRRDEQNDDAEAANADDNTTGSEEEKTDKSVV